MREEILLRYPRVMRRVGGYNLDEFLPADEGGEPDKPFNLARMLVGSEGTLGLTVAATMRLAPLPPGRALCSLQFDDLLEAMEAAPLILEHRPSAVELIDRFMLDKTRGRVEFAPLRGFIRGDPGAVLLVELYGDSEDERVARIDRARGGPEGAAPGKLSAPRPRRGRAGTHLGAAPRSG